MGGIVLLIYPSLLEALLVMYVVLSFHLRELSSLTPGYLTPSAFGKNVLVFSSLSAFP